MFFCFLFFFDRKNGASNHVVATAQIKFASEARPSQYIVPFGNTTSDSPLSMYQVSFDSL